LRRVIIQRNFMNELQNAQALIGIGIISLGILIVTPIVLLVLGPPLGYVTLAVARHHHVKYRLLLAILGVPVRLLYHLIVAVSILYSYLFIPVLLFGVMTIIGVSAYRSFVRTPSPDDAVIGLQLLVAGILFLSAFLPAAVAMLFVQSRGPTFERQLKYEEAPLLWNIVKEVARRVDIRPVDIIAITPGVIIDMIEQGGFAPTFWRTGRRKLLLGFAALPGMTQSQFKAILAHEYGHFNNRGTAGGSWIHQVHTATSEAIHELDTESAETESFRLMQYLHFTRILIKFYYRYIFLPATIGAAQLQEIIADRCAVGAYGISNFSNALRHIVRQGVVFEAQFQREEEDARKTKRRIHNLYTLPAFPPEREQEITSLIEQAMNQTTSIDDTYLAPNERIRLVSAIRLDEEIETDTGMVWDLFTNPEALQVEMTQVLQRNLYSYHGHSWAKPE
jgi:Zn-dependent protease with chaperone function